jgi:membrane-associated phospholipid phosphatase
MPPSHAHVADPARPALLALFVYLAVQVVPLLVGRPASPPPLLAAHLVGIAIVALLLRARADGSPAAGTLRQWVPLLALPLLYAELAPLIGALHDGTRDALVLRWESALVGQPARTLAGRFPSRALSEALHAGYLSYYPLIYVPPLLLAVRGASRREALGETILALTLAYTLCFVLFTVFPVEGPRYRFGASTGAPAGPLRDLARALLQEGSSRGTAFPSSHVAVSLAQALAAWRHQRAVGAVVAVCAAGVAVGAVYGGFHYAVDVGAGIVVAVAAAAASRRIFATAAPPGPARGGGAPLTVTAGRD